MKVDCGDPETVLVTKVVVVVVGALLATHTEMRTPVLRAVEQVSPAQHPLYDVVLAEPATW